MFFMIILMLPIVALVTVWFFFTQRRFLQGIERYSGSKKQRSIMWVLAAAVGSLCLFVSNTGVLIILHLMAFSLVLRIVNFVIKKAFKNRYTEGFSVWKRIYSCSVIPILLTTVVITVGYFNMYNIRKTEYTVYTQKDLRDGGYKIALLADIHYGVTLDKRELSVVCDRISAENVDIVVLCGDIVDSSTSKAQMNEVFEVLGSIKSQYGIYYIFGNHDRPHEVMPTQFEFSQLTAAIESNGITIMKDSVVPINDEILLVGRDDKWDSGRKSIAELLYSTDKSCFIVTLDHQPTEYKENAKAGTDLLLSGHTHGGQIWPVKVIDELFGINDLNYGITDIDSDSKAVVTSGIAGWAYPVKTSSVSEFVIISIKNEK